MPWLQWVQHIPAPSVAPGLDANRIRRGLWIGSVPPRGGTLRRAGFDLVVLCAFEREYVGAYGRAPSPEMFPGVRMLHVPLDDAELAQDELRRADGTAETVAHTVVRGGRALVTCFQGRNRSGLVTALALRRLTGMSGQECLLEVQRHRSWALTNPSFQKYLKSLPSRG